MSSLGGCITVVFTRLVADVFSEVYTSVSVIGSVGTLLGAVQFAFQCSSKDVTGALAIAAIGKVTQPNSSTPILSAMLGEINPKPDVSRDKDRT